MRVHAETLAFLGQKLPRRSGDSAVLVEIDELPLRAVNQLIKALAASEARIITLTGLKPSTYYRRKQRGEALQGLEADAVLRIARVVQEATRVFGTAAQARAWLAEPSAHLDDRAPLDLLGTDAGARTVEDELGRIEWGVF